MHVVVRHAARARNIDLHHALVLVPKVRNGAGENAAVAAVELDGIALLQ